MMESDMENKERFLSELAVFAVDSILMSACQSARIKVEIADRIIWLDIFTNESTQPVRYVAQTNDICDLVGVGPSFRFGSSDPEAVKSAISLYLLDYSTDLSDELSATLYRRAQYGDLPELEGNSHDGRFPKISWEPIGPTGFGC
jgi:hypothetical protein